MNAALREWDLEPGSDRTRLRICEWSGGGADGGSRTPVVILHGFLEQGAAWEGVARALRGRVLAPDHRGHGRSAHVGVGGFYHFWDYVGDIDALVEHLGQPIDLIGHSMGGTIACLFSGCRPDRVRRLILVEGLGPPDAEELAVDRARGFLADLRSPPAHPTEVTAEEAAGRLRRWNPAVPETRARALAERLLADGTWGWDPRHRMRAPVPFQARMFRKFLAQITAPVLVIDGADSPFRVPDAAERQAAIPNATHLTLPGGHLLHYDAPDALATAIRAFLENP